MSNLRKFWFFLSLFMVYTQGLWERVFSLPPHTTIIVEIPVLIYLLLSMLVNKTFITAAPGRSIVIIYIIYTFIASIGNQSDYVNWAKHIRYFLYFYLIFLSLWKTKISQKQWLSILKFLFFLILIQGLGSAFDFLILNQRLEGHVGLMSSIGGTTAATFPLLVFSLSIVIFIFTLKQEKKINWYLLLIVVSASFVGFGSSKLAIFFTIPAFLLISVLLSYFQLKGNPGFYRKIFVLAVLIVVAIPIFIFGLSSTRVFNSDPRGQTSNIEIVKEVLNYSQNYETDVSQHGHTIGRTGTNYQIINVSTKNINSFLFGFGYGEVKEEDTQAKLGFKYGIVGFTRDIVNGGWIVMLLTVLILSKVILTNQSANYKFTWVFRIMTFLVFLLTYFGYSSDFTASLKINYILAIICVFINSPVHSETLNTIVSRYFFSEKIK